MSSSARSISFRWTATRRKRRVDRIQGSGAAVGDRDHFAYGLHAAESILKRRPRDVSGAYVLAGQLHGRLHEVLRTLERTGLHVDRLRRDELDRLARGGVHQGVVLKVPPPREQSLNDLESLVESRPQSVQLLVLDQVEDPRNLGACLRTADAVGIDGMIVPRARSAKLGAGALKAATGAAEAVPLFVVPNLARCLRWLREAGVSLIGADERGERTLFEIQMAAPVALVLGAEGRGLRRLTREACDELVRIPMQGTVESLNVSVAAGVLLYEMLRQSRSTVSEQKGRPE
jgi:23S rRNA (guanosine2251-2'-O)-methyltransferase